MVARPTGDAGMSTEQERFQKSIKTFHYTTDRNCTELYFFYKDPVSGDDVFVFEMKIPRLTLWQKIKLLFIG